jgi:ABC-type glycerol-3-phosphate transport system substrate-binding protein
MNTSELVAQKMQCLPEEQQDQVLDFVEFLTSKYQQKQDNRSAEQRAIDRLADVEDQDNPEKWITVVEIDQEVDIESSLENLRKSGYKIQIPSKT